MSKFQGRIAADAIVRAVKLVYEASCLEDGVRPEFDRVLKTVHERRNDRLWQRLVPVSTNPDDYSDLLSDDDRLFIAGVAAVGLAVLEPPDIA